MTFVGGASLGLRSLLWTIVCANLFVLAYEEPTLRRQFGASYDDYTRHVGRWLPKIR